MAITTEIELDADVLAQVEARAASTGRPRNDLIAEAIGRWLASGTLMSILNEHRRETVATDEEAMEIAISELKAMRAEQAAEASTANQ